MTEDKNLIPPVPSSGDRVHTFIKAALSVIPTLGGPAVELFSAIVTPPLERRRQVWMEEVGKGLSNLLSKNLIVLEDLSTNGVFLDTILQASQAVMRTSNEEKRTALRNAVLNSALPNPPEESLQLMFLSLVDQFTPWHLRLLALFQDPAKWTQEHNTDFKSIYMGGISDVLEIAFPELKGRRDFYDQIWADLNQKGLATTESLHSTMTSAGLTEKRTTDLGDRFLQFLSTPEGDA